MNPFDLAEHEHEQDTGYYARLRAKISATMSHVPLRTRITGLVMVAVGLSVALASIAAWVTVRNQILSQTDQTLLVGANRAAALRHYEEKQRVTNTPPPIPVSITDVLYVSVDASGDPTQIYASSDSNVPLGTTISPNTQDRQVAMGALDYSFRTVTVPQTDGGSARYRSVTVRVQQPAYGSPAETIMVAQSMVGTEQTLSRLGLVSILVGIAGIAVAGSAGITVGRAGLRPVDRLTEATEYVARTGDLRPIEVQGTDELARLATSFNAMLTALARSQEHQRRLIADAGHELRTPLTSMRTNIDLLAQVFGNPASVTKISDADRSELISDVRAQMEELSVLVGDLVELSRDAKPPAAPEPVNLADVIRQAIERVRRRAPHIRFETQVEPWFLEGDPASLERAVTNLLDNAAKWSPENGTVTIQLHDGLLQVSDEGPGIDEEDMPHVFERFYRSPEARTMSGSGLGLAIVRQAAENHGGRVAAARAPGGGALLGLWLPGRPSEQASDDAPVSSTT